MDAISLLKKYKKRVEPRIERYFAKKLKHPRIDIVTTQAVNAVAGFTLGGGKRIRPALVYYGYLASGGKNIPAILEASIGIELIHSFLLIHDDVIDKDEKRHGVPTVHEVYKKIGKKISPNKDNEHFGNSMAIIAGDMAHAMANEIIFNSNFAPEIIIKALDKLQDIVYVTISGEMLDVIMENRGETTEEEILSMFEGKTSKYTFEGPLHFGSILSGNGNKKLLNDFTRYSLPLGKAFQLQDDILGLFGDEKKLGKPIGSDVVEGKQTLLLLKALEKANKKQKTIIKKYLGKKDLKKSELEEFRNVVRETGALEYNQNLAKKFVEESIKALEKIEFKNEEAKFFMKGIAKYIIEREV